MFQLKVLTADSMLKSILEDWIDLRLILLLGCIGLFSQPLASQTVTHAEYFWDTDPGPGNGTSLNAQDGNFDETLERVVANGIAAAALGPHRFGIRFNSDSTGWGGTFTTVLHVLANTTTSVPAVLAGEYFWDVDPGAGNGTPLLAFDGNYNEALEVATATGLGSIASGPHRLGVRINNGTSVWGSAFSTVVYVEDTTMVNPPVLQSAEYFIDVDPGQGNATPLLAFDGNFDEALETCLETGLGGISSGPHALGIRLNSVPNGWGATFTTVFYLEDTATIDQPGIIAGEYFWDVDPGQGSATALLAFDGNYDEALEVASANSLGGLSTGAHTFNARFQNQQGNWGQVFTTVVAIEDTAVTDQAHLVQAEAFIGADPGPGNGTAVAAADGNFDEALEQLADSLSSLALQPGPHLLSMRVQDEDQIWGPVFSIVIRVDSNLIPITTTINGPSQFNCGQSLNGITYTTPANTGSSYTWTVVGGNIANGQGSPNVQVNWTGPPPHQISVQGCNSNGCGNDFVLPVNIPPTLNANLVVSGSTTVCNGDSVLLTAPIGSQYNVGWLQNGIPIPGAIDSIYQASSTGSYQAVFSATGFCSDTSSAETVTVLSPLVADAGGNLVFCPGDDSLALGGSPTATGSQGSYTYVWSGQNLGSTTAANPMAAPIPNAVYSVMVTDGNGCQESDSVSIAVNPGLVASAGLDTILCTGATANLGGLPAGSGGTGNLSYQWSPTAGLNNPNLSNPTANSNALGTYILEITDANGCQSRDTTEVMRHPALFADAGADTLLCGSGSVILGGTSPASGGDGPYSLLWTPANGLSNPSIGNPVANVMTTTTYDLQVTDLNGCVSNDQITVQVEPEPTAGFSFSTNLGTVSFTSTAQQASNVLWLFGDNNSSTALNPIHTYQASGVYDVCQVAYSNCGTDTFCQQVNVTVINIEEGAQGDFSIYPNPHQGSFWLEMHALDAEAMTIRNAFGQVVFRKKAIWLAGSRTRIAVDELPSGVYYLELEGSGEAWTRRMVIIE